MVWQEELAKNGWMWPAYMSNGAVGNLSKQLQAAPAGRKRAVLEAALPQFYSPGYLAAMVTERYSVTPVVREFHAHIAEAVEAAMLGSYNAAVTTLVPVVEGIIRKIGEGANRRVGVKAHQLSAEIDHMVAHEKRTGFGDHASEERVQMLLGFKAFFDEHLYAHTNDYDGQGELNRNGILHGLFQKFGGQANFCILISIVDHLTFIMGFRTSGISVLAPGDTKASSRLTGYYLALRLLASTRPPTAKSGVP